MSLLINNGDDEDDDDSMILNQMIVISWATGYFTADLVDCVVRLDPMFIIHAIVGFGLIWLCSIEPYYTAKAASKGYFVELSSFAFQKWRVTKTKNDFVKFLISFFLSRIVYTPIFLLKLLNINWKDMPTVGIWACVSFYIMQCIWFGKGLQMYFNYKEEKNIVEPNKEKKQMEKKKN